MLNFFSFFGPRRDHDFTERSKVKSSGLYLIKFKGTESAKKRCEKLGNLFLKFISLDHRGEGQRGNVRTTLRSAKPMSQARAIQKGLLFFF